MSDTPPPPPGMPPIPPPPPPPGFGEGNEEDEVEITIDNEDGDGSEMNNIHQLVDELPSLADIESPQPPPLGLETPPPLPPDFYNPPPPPPPGFEAIEEEGKGGVDELEIQSFDDTLSSLEQMNEEEIVEEINV
ncbi:MAG: hypothetical protein MKZ53_04310, partial [Candidatus Thalassarchaeum sp.]|nr:hypothetical protein [Candidatus Thalassarchaeum sp.]